MSQQILLYQKLLSVVNDAVAAATQAAAAATAAAAAAAQSQSQSQAQAQSQSQSQAQAQAQRTQEPLEPQALNSSQRNQSNQDITFPSLQHVADLDNLILENLSSSSSNNPQQASATLTQALLYILAHPPVPTKRKRRGQKKEKLKLYGSNIQLHLFYIFTLLDLVIRNSRFASLIRPLVAENIRHITHYILPAVTSKGHAKMYATAGFVFHPQFADQLKNAFTTALLQWKVTEPEVFTRAVDYVQARATALHLDPAIWNQNDRRQTYITTPDSAPIHNQYNLITYEPTSTQWLPSQHAQHSNQILPQTQTTLNPAHQNIQLITILSDFHEIFQELEHGLNVLLQSVATNESSDHLQQQHQQQLSFSIWKEYNIPPLPSQHPGDTANQPYYNQKNKSIYTWQLPQLTANSSVLGHSLDKNLQPLLDVLSQRALQLQAKKNTLMVLQNSHEQNLRNGPASGPGSRSDTQLSIAQKLDRLELQLWFKKLLAPIDHALELFAPTLNRGIRRTPTCDDDIHGEAHVDRQGEHQDHNHGSHKDNDDKNKNNRRSDDSNDDDVFDNVDWQEDTLPSSRSPTFPQPPHSSSQNKNILSLETENTNDFGPSQYKDLHIYPFEAENNSPGSVEKLRQKSSNSDFIYSKQYFYSFSGAYPNRSRSLNLQNKMNNASKSTDLHNKDILSRLETSLAKRRKIDSQAINSTLTPEDPADPVAPVASARPHEFVASTVSTSPAFVSLSQPLSHIGGTRDITTNNHHQRIQNSTKTQATPSTTFASTLSNSRNKKANVNASSSVQSRLKAKLKSMRTSGS